MAFEARPSGQWFQELQSASFRGIPFAVRGGRSSFGRRNAVHEYPFRDTPWVEDLGRQGRQIRLVGFLVGDDAMAQRDRLVAAVETRDDGQLVHPTLGRLRVSLLNLDVEESTEGRMFGLQFSFVESGDKLFPGAFVSTSSAVLTQVQQSRISAAYDFTLRVRAAYRQGSAVIQQAELTADRWIRQVQETANDATNVYNLVSTLKGAAQGLYGRYFGGRTRSGLYTAPATVTLPTVADLLAKGSANRVAVQQAETSLAAASTGVDTQAISDSTNSLVEAVRVAAIDPADAIRILSSMAMFPTSVYQTNAPIGAAINTVIDATGDLFRRAAVISLARAALSYQPSSYDDAITLRQFVCDALDAEITVAGDQNEDQTFAALRSLRGAVSVDLASRGASLATVSTFQSNTPIPAPLWALKLYRDLGRTDALIIQIDPVHPAFVPTSFQALTK